VEVNEPPENLLLPTPMSEYHGTTYGDVIDYVEQLRGDLKSCNQDKQSVKDFFDKQKPSK